MTSSDMDEIVAAGQLAKIRAARASRDVPYQPGLTSWPPRSYERIGGLWASEQRLFIESRQRRPSLGLRLAVAASSCIDFNGHSNAWILLNLLAAARLGAAPRLRDDDLADSLSALTRSFLASEPSAGFQVYFWPVRIPARGGGHAPAICPTNLTAKFTTLLRSVRAAYSIFDHLGLRSLIRQRAHNSIDPARMQWALGMFRLPSGLDNASLFLSLGLLLAERVDVYPRAAAAFPIDVESFVATLLRCAYRPFSAERSPSTIDTRTYYWLRPFLAEAAAKARSAGRSPTVILPTTWALTQDESCRAASDGGEARTMPFHINNVNLVGSANIVEALTIAMTGSSAPSWLDADVEQLYLDAAHLLAWSIDTGIVEERPDLTLLYHPDVGKFYHAAARVLFRLRNSSDAVCRLPVLEAALRALERSMEKATRNVLAAARKDGAGRLVWEGCLGAAEDEVYATSIAANFLFDAWTTQSSDGALRFLAGTPEEVRHGVRQSCGFLAEQAAAESRAWGGAVFAGDIRSKWSYRWRYPANTIMHADGTKIDPATARVEDLMKSPWTLGVTGVLSEEEYQRLLADRQFGLEPCTRRSPERTFYYWSDESVVRSLCLLALIKYRRVSWTTAG